jgi:rhamnosyltransferase
MNLRRELVSGSVSLNASSSEDAGRQTVTLIIPVFRGHRYLGDLMRAIEMQETDGFRVQIQVIETESEESSRGIAESFSGCRYRILPRSSFSHPGTRNWGASLSSDDYIVFLSQDALPADSSWLRELLRPFRAGPHIAASYSRQIPRPEATPFEVRDIECGAGPFDEIRQVHFEKDRERKDYEKWGPSYIRFSNVSACYRGDLLRKHPFDSRLPMCEDQEWCKRMIEQGYAIYYASRSAVFHSHRLTFRELYFRQFEYGRSFKRFVPPASKPGLRTRVLGCVLADWLFLWGSPGSWSHKIFWSLLSPLYRILSYLAFSRGWRHD